MPGEFDYLAACWTEFKRQATEADRTLHDSFFVELENYTLRRGIRRLSEQTRTRIVQEIGTRAIEKAVVEGVGTPIDSESIRIQLKEKCPDDFGACYRAAIEVIQGIGRPDEIALLDPFDWRSK